MNERQHWLDRPEHVTLLVRAVWVICGLLLLADLAYDKHVHFSFERWFGFFAFFGFGAYMLIVNGAKLLRRLVQRPENYYGGEDD